MLIQLIGTSLAYSEMHTQAHQNIKKMKSKMRNLAISVDDVPYQVYIVNRTISISSPFNVKRHLTHSLLNNRQKVSLTHI